MAPALTLERVQALVAQVAGPDRIPSGADPDTPLKDGGFWLDSASLLEVIIACEAEFDVVLYVRRFPEQCYSLVFGLPADEPVPARKPIRR